MPRSKALRQVLLAASLSLASTAAFAVDVNGRIKGTVTDPAGAVVPNAQVVATNQATGVRFTTTSQTDGGYQFQQLPVGTYTVTASASGFNNFSATGIVINIDQEYVEAIQLNVGGGNETVSVQADAVQVNTTDMQLNNIVNSAQMVDLPLIGRNFTNLETTLPGVQGSSDRFGGFSANGAQTQQSSFLINGADTNDLPLNSISFEPNLDAINQFNLVTGPLNAEYDRNSGAIVSATIKQGTNAIHGDAFEFYRDTFLNTANFFQFNNSTGAKQVSAYHQNIFGGTLGGPIKKDKLFIFGAYEGRRQRTPQTSYGNVNVLSNANRGGDFSDDIGGSGPNGYTFSTNPIPSTIATKFPGCVPSAGWAACLTTLGGVIPTSAFDPVAAKLLTSYVPAPNSGTYGYIFNPITSTTQDQVLGRVDFDPNPRNQINFVGIYQRAPSVSTIPFTGATVPGFAEVDRTDIYQYTADYVRQLSATAVNDLAVHYTRFNYQAVTPQSTIAPSSLGFSITPENLAAQSVPTISLNGGPTIGFSTNGPQPRIDQTYQVDETLSKTLGNHNFKFGYDGRRFNVSNPFSANNSGSFSFDPTSGPYSTGDSYLDLVLGVPASYSQGSGATIQAYAFLNYLFAQDTWKVTKDLTLSYGIGYQIDTPLHNRQYGGEAVTCFNPGVQSKVFTTAPTGITYPGDPSCGDASFAYTRYSEVGPRFGFAYAPDLGGLSGGAGAKKLSIRGGFGIYYNRTEEETSLNNLETPPFGLSSHGIGDSGGYPTFANPYVEINGGVSTSGKPIAASINNKFPYAFPKPGQAIDYTVYEPLIVNEYARNFRAPYSENFQLSIEREFPSRVIARISYVGALARHNQITYEGNPETAAGHAACLANSDCVANRNYQAYYYPENTAYGSIDPATGGAYFTSIGFVGAEGSSSYNSFQASLQKDTTHGLLFQASYTYAHALDNGSNFENSGYGGTTRGYNQYNQQLNYGDSAYDVRNRFVFSPVYTVPFKHGGNSFSATNLLLSGWQISGIVTLAQGFPYDISYGGSVSRSLYCSAYVAFYACPDVPNQVAPLTRLDPRTTKSTSGTRTGWFGSSSFAPEAIGTFGNVHRNPYHGPGINNTNAIFAKNVPLAREGTVSLQLRMEVDNVFNHTSFSNPDGNISDGTFGQITAINSNTSGRNTQLAGKIYF